MQEGRKKSGKTTSSKEKNEKSDLMDSLEKFSTKIEQRNAEQRDTEQIRKEEEWMQKINQAKRVAQLGSVAAKTAGYGGVANALQDGSDLFKSAEQGAGPNAIRKFGSNAAGKMGRNKAIRRGLSKNKSSALGGALSGALQGEGVGGIIKGGSMWWAFGGLATGIFFLPALIYLDYYYIKAKNDAKGFIKMMLWQKIILAMANILFLFILIFLLALLTILTLAIQCNENKTSCARDFLKNIF